MKRRDVLESILWAEEEFGSMITGGAVPRDDVMRQVRAGLISSAGLVRVLDGDGVAVEQERRREGFKLTPAGRQWLRNRGFD